MAPGRLQNPGVESPQQKGDSRWKRSRWTNWVTRSPSCRPTSTPRPRACSISSVSSMRAAAGTTASAPAPPGVGLAPGAAREHVRVARALGTLPRLAQALARAEVSYSKVRALTRVATLETEERLLAVGRAGTTEHVERIVRGWRRVDRQVEAREAARQHASRALHVYPDTDGTVTVRGRLTPEIGALLVQALTAARERLYQQAHAEDAGTGALDVLADTPTMAQQQADALALLAETALHHGIDPGAPGERYQVVVHVGPRGRRTRSSWHVPAPGVRRQPGGDATRPGRPSRGGRCANPDDSPSATPGAPPPRPRLPLPGLWGPLRTRPSHSSLGAGRSHHVVESRPALSPAPPRGPRGGLRA